MANLTWNKVSCSNHKLFKWVLRQLINSKTDKIDFNILSKVPSSLIKSEEIREWKYNNWGSLESVDNYEIENSDEEESLIFYTKWSEPYNIIKLLQKKLNKEFPNKNNYEIIWDFDTELMDNSGYYSLTPDKLFNSIFNV